MAYKPMAPNERASIEAQVILKGAVELTSAQVTSGGLDPNESVLDALMDNAIVLANTLGDVKAVLMGGAVAEAPVQTEAEAVDVITTVFPEATTAPTVAAPRSGSNYVDDNEYQLVHKLWISERTNGVVYGSKDSMFMDNQAIRKLFQAGKTEYPQDYWADSLRGQPIPVTKNGKCALGDFKIKKGVFVDEQGNVSLGQGDGNHPMAGKSGYFGGLVKHSPFNWGERPDAIDPQNWLAAV